MAKTAKLKTAHKRTPTLPSILLDNHSQLIPHPFSTASLHSRANRHLPSPAPQSSTTTTTTTTTHNLPTPTVLSANPSNKIHKSQAPKPLKRNQRLRIARGRERAETVLEKRDVKVADIEEKTRGKKGRRAGWEELNEGVLRALLGGQGKSEGVGALRKKMKRKRKREGNGVGIGDRRQQQQQQQRKEDDEDGWVDDTEDAVAMEDVEEEEAGEEEEEEEVIAPMPGDDAVESEAAAAMESRHRLDAARDEDLEQIS